MQTHCSKDPQSSGYEGQKFLHAGKRTVLHWVLNSQQVVEVRVYKQAGCLSLIYSPRKLDLVDLSLGEVQITLPFLFANKLN